MSTTITALPVLGTVADATLFATETAGVTQSVSGSVLKSYTSNMTGLALTSSSGTFTTDVSVGGTLTTGTLHVSGLSTLDGNVVIHANLTVDYNQITSGNLTAGNLTTAGTMTAGNLVVPNSITAGTVSATTVTATSLSGTLLTAAQPNITSIGTLNNLTMIGNAVINAPMYAHGVYDNSTRVVSVSSGSGNLVISGGAITLQTSGPGAATFGNATTVPVITTDVYGRVSTISNVAISVGVSGYSGASGAAGAAGSAGASGTSGYSGSTGASGTSGYSGTNGTIGSNGASGTSGYSGTNGTIGSNGASGTSGTSGYSGASGAPGGGGGSSQAALLQGSTLSSNVTASSLTSVGTLTGLTVSAAIIPNANATINLGDSTHWFNTFYGVSTQAKYADLAELYTCNANLDPGTVVVFAPPLNAYEVVLSSVANDRKVAGVVSTNPAYLMNADLTDGVAIALQGRVPCKVLGPANRGDMLVTSDIPGVAMVNNTPAPGTVIGKVLKSSYVVGVSTIEIVVGKQ